MNRPFTNNTRIILKLLALVFSYIRTGLLLLLISFLMLKIEMSGMVVSGLINFTI